MQCSKMDEDHGLADPKCTGRFALKSFLRGWLRDCDVEREAVNICTEFSGGVLNSHQSTSARP